MKPHFLLAFAAVGLSNAQTLCGQFDYFASDPWYINNNEWGASAGTGTQCTYVDSVNSGGISWHTDWTWSGGNNNVKSYPYSGRQLTTKKLVRDINSIPTVAEWRYEKGNNIRANVAYDLFTAADPNHETSSGDYELMIWLSRLGGVQPIGSSTGSVNVNGYSWELYVGYNGDMKVFSFVSSNSISSFNQDINPFFEHLTQQQGFPASSQYLITLQFGTEPFTGDDCRFIVGHWDGNVN